MESWKEAKAILILKKGDREDPHNWRPVSITSWPIPSICMLNGEMLPRNECFGPPLFRSAERIH
jgi:hypothetical protein